MAAASQGNTTHAVAMLNQIHGLRMVTGTDFAGNALAASQRETVDTPEGTVGLELYMRAEPEPILPNSEPT